MTAAPGGNPTAAELSALRAWKHNAERILAENKRQLDVQADFIHVVRANANYDHDTIAGAPDALNNLLQWLPLLQRPVVAATPPHTAPTDQETP